MKRLLALFTLVLMLAAFPFSVIADDDFEDVEQYNEIDFVSDTDSEVSEEEITPEVTPVESAEEEQLQENEGNPSEVTPETTPESTPEPDSTISDLIETVNHNFDSLHSDNIHLMVVVCIGIGSIIGFLLISKILP